MLLFSSLGKDSVIPLFRYDTGDTGKLFSFRQFQRFLKSNGHENLLPELKLPLAAIYGRRNNYLIHKNKKIHPADIKFGLYEDFELAGRTTGYFKIIKQDKTPLIEIQLKPGVKPDNHLTSMFSYSLLKYIELDIPIKCYTYHDFPYGMELSYEHKFVNL